MDCYLQNLWRYCGYFLIFILLWGTGNCDWEYKQETWVEIGKWDLQAMSYITFHRLPSYVIQFNLRRPVHRPGDSLIIIIAQYKAIPVRLQVTLMVDLCIYLLSTSHLHNQTLKYSPQMLAANGFNTSLICAVRLNSGCSEKGCVTGRVLSSMSRDCLHYNKSNECVYLR